MNEIQTLLRENCGRALLMDTWETLNNAVEMVENKANPRALREYMRIASYFYGKDRIAEAIKIYPRYACLEIYL